MTQQSIYISDQGELLLIDAPDKSQYIIDDDGIERYEAALASAIKEGIKFKGEEEFFALRKVSNIWDDVPKLIQWAKENKGQIFPLPTGYKISFEDVGKCKALADDSEHCYCSDGCKETVAILSKLEEEKVVAPSEEVKLPKSKEFIMTEPAARTFYMLLNRGDNPIRVLDEAICYYSEVTKKQQEMLEKYINRFGVLE